MRKSLLFVLVLCLMVVPAMAQDVDWTGLTSTSWSDIAGNWSGNPDNSGYDTEKASVDIQDVAWYGGTYLPTIVDGDNNSWGWLRLRNPGTVITQTGGFHAWANGSGTDGTMNIYAGAALQMTGGYHLAYGNVYVGAYTGTTNGTGSVDIWGDGVFQVTASPYWTPVRDNLDVRAGSVIDIRDNGYLVVDMSQLSNVNTYIADGRIVNGGGGPGLAVTNDGTYVYVTPVPEPGTLLLLCLGLGSLALIRRK